jgi:hypothetical protein
MMGTAAPSAAPAHALKAWVDNHSLFFELRGVNGPYVMAFQRHELGKALAILFTTFETETHGEQYIRPALIAKALIKDGIDQRDLDAAAKALREIGILK